MDDVYRVQQEAVRTGGQGGGHEGRCEVQGTIGDRKIVMDRGAQFILPFSIHQSVIQSVIQS